MAHVYVITDGLVMCATWKLVLILVQDMEFAWKVIAYVRKNGCMDNYRIVQSETYLMESC